MKSYILTITSSILIFTTLIFSESRDKYSKIKIYIPDKSILNRVWESGIDYEGSSGKIGGWMEFVAGSYELEQLSKFGIKYSIVEDDISKKILQGLVKGPVNALGFGYGSMGGYYTFEEVLKQLDTMKLIYPNLITLRDSIGHSQENRAIWAVKISDNPDQNESDEPEVLYTALHHAREPEGMMTVIYYMWWLLQNYGTDPTATYLVNNRQLWFIPVVNPDGYVYNQNTNPSGGGMWRKNRRNNGGSYGVDLNRNYGPQEMWDSPYGGSSTTPSSDTYRGPVPFSEPEDYAIGEFMWNHTIMTCLNYHTYGNYLIYPWGYQPFETDDSLAFREFSFDMTAENRYLSGTDQQTVNYTTRGNSDDFMYGGTMTRTFAMTPEVGTSGFWPPTDQILPLAIENLKSNIYYSYVAGQYTVLKNYNIIGDDGNEEILPNKSFTLQIKIRNKGLSDGNNIQISISSNSEKITFVSNTINLDLIPSRTDSTLSFYGNILSGCPSPSQTEFYVTITDAKGYYNQDTISTFVGKQFIVFADSCTDGLINWNSTGGWATTARAHTSPYAFTDSPYGNYLTYANSTLTLNRQLNLSIYKFAFLKFWTKWEIEPTFDFATIEVSTNGGASWNTIKTKLSRRGSNRGTQLEGTWGYDGYTPGLDWIEQEADLTPYLKYNIALRFRLSSDGGEQRDGWYLDDIRVVGYRKQSPALYISDNGTGMQVLSFDEFPNATDEIDVNFGEEELPPKPESGTFDARWLITGTNGALKNYKDTIGENKTTNIFIAEIQPGTGGYPISISWEPKYLLPGAWKIRDGETHGTIYNKNMWTDTSLIVTDLSVHSIEVIHTWQDTFYMYLKQGWNLISIPGLINDSTKDHILYNGISHAFEYQHGYKITSNLQPYKGYWLKYPTPEIMQVIGTTIVHDTIQVPAGWWLIGGLSYMVPLTNISCDTPPCDIWKYDGYYRNDQPLSSGEGFWFKGPKKLIISCYPFNNSGYAKQNDEKYFGNMFEIKISDSKQRTRKLYLGIDDGEIVSGNQYELPPAPPEVSFDARFSSQRFVESFSGQNDHEELKMIFQSDSYPITIEWENIESNSDIQFEMFVEQGNKSNTYSLNSPGSILIDDPVINSIKIRKKQKSTIPKEFYVTQNYPNPFNPTTSIIFELPTDSYINLKIYDILGREIQSVLQNKIYSVGQHHLTIDGNALPSGLYFYRFEAKSIASSTTNYQRIMKMMILK